MNNTSTLIIKTAAVTAAGLITYFVLMNALNLSKIVELRFFNFVIIFGGIYYLLKTFRINQGGKIEYVFGLGIGAFTSLLTSVFFAGFIYFYLTYFDQAFMDYLITQRSGLTPVNAAFVIIVEGTTSGACISLALMQYYQRKVSKMKSV